MRCGTQCSRVSSKQIYTLALYAKWTVRKRELALRSHFDVNDWNKFPHSSKRRCNIVFLVQPNAFVALMQCVGIGEESFEYSPAHFSSSLSVVAILFSPSKFQQSQRTSNSSSSSSSSSSSNNRPRTSAEQTVSNTVNFLFSSFFGLFFCNFFFFCFFATCVCVGDFMNIILQLRHTGPQ